MMRPSYLAFLTTLIATPAMADCQNLYTPGSKLEAMPTVEELGACEKLADDLRVEKVGVWVPAYGDKRYVTFNIVSPVGASAVERLDLAEDLCRVVGIKGVTIQVYPRQTYKWAKFDLTRLGEAERTFTTEASDQSGSTFCK